jgi:hypothetical protein
MSLEILSECISNAQQSIQEDINRYARRACGYEMIQMKNEEGDVGEGVISGRRDERYLYQIPFPTKHGP